TEGVESASAGAEGASEGAASASAGAESASAGAEGGPEDAVVETVTVLHEADMQFAGQTNVLTVPVARTEFTREELAETFERAYLERFGVELREMRALVMSLRTAVIG